MVVIAVIGILASIVLVTLSRARVKARDARILLGLREIKTIAALIESTYGSYANLCDSITVTLNQNAPYPYGDQLGILENDILEQVGGTPSHFCCANTIRYCVSSILSNFDLICIDETGTNKTGMVCGTPDMPSICSTVRCLPPPSPPPPP